MKQFGFACLFFLGFALFETAILSNIIFLPAIPDFILICSLYLSVQNGRLYGTCSGFAGGLVLDFLSATPFGFNCLLRTVFGYFAGWFNKTLNINGLIFPVFLGAAATLIKAFILWVISIFYPNVNITYKIISATFGFEILFNSLLTPVVFRFLDLFKKSICLDPQKVH